MKIEHTVENKFRVSAWNSFYIVNSILYFNLINHYSGRESERKVNSDRKMFQMVIRSDSLRQLTQ